MTRRGAGAALTLALVAGAGAALAANPLLPGAPAESIPWQLPGPLGDLVGWINQVQRALQGALTRSAGAAVDGSWAAAVALVGLSFAYGVVHAAGPGHGKVVLVAYLVSRRTRPLRALLLAGAVALVQSLTAIAAVAVLAAALDLSHFQVLRQVGLLELASAALIVLLGVTMLVNARRGRDACGHDHAHDHAGHDHRARDRSDAAASLALPLAAGLRPCTGALLVLLFTLGSGALAVGIVSTLAMGAGVALTLGLIGLASLGSNRALSRLDRLRPAAPLGLETLLGYAGGAGVVALGLLLLLAALADPA